LEAVTPVTVEGHQESFGIVSEVAYAKANALDVLRGNGALCQLEKRFKDDSLKPDSVLPLAVYYRADRLGQAGAKGLDSGVDRSKLSRLSAMENALDGSLAVASAIRWLRREQFIALQEGSESLGFSAARKAMRNCLPNCTDIHYSVKEEALVIGFSDGSWRTFDSLSDGQKIILAMVADLATRAAWLNPGLGDEVLQKTPGVVLIDELDLHLHPCWQRHVVEDLRRTFPCFQFIASSHSPFIIQSMREGEVLNLDEQPAGSRSEYWKSGIEEIAEEEMGVESGQRSERYTRMLDAAEEYFRAALSPSTETLADPGAVEAKLQAVLDEFPDDPALEARLRLETIAANAGLGREKAAPLSGSR
jgi:hypothetical protein